MKEYTVVEGVQDYEDPEMTKLDFAARDAGRMAQAPRDVCHIYDSWVFASSDIRCNGHG